MCVRRMARSVCCRWSPIWRRKSTNTSREHAHTHWWLSLRPRAIRSGRAGEARGGGLQLLHLQQVRIPAPDRPGRPIQARQRPRSALDVFVQHARRQAFLLFHLRREGVLHSSFASRRSQRQRALHRQRYHRIDVREAVRRPRLGGWTSRISRPGGYLSALSAPHEEHNSSPCAVFFAPAPAFFRARPAADGQFFPATAFRPRKPTLFDRDPAVNAFGDAPMLRGSTVWQRMSEYRSHDRVRLLTLWESSGSTVSLQAGKRGDPSLQWTSRSMNRGGSTRGLLDRLFAVSLAGAGNRLRRSDRPTGAAAGTPRHATRPVGAGPK